MARILPQNAVQTLLSQRQDLVAIGVSTDDRGMLILPSRCLHGPGPASSASLTRRPFSREDRSACSDHDSAPSDAFAAP